MILATAFPAGYCSSQVVAKSATGFDGPNDSRRTSAPSDAGAVPYTPPPQPTKREGGEAGGGGAATQASRPASAAGVSVAVPTRNSIPTCCDTPLPATCLNPVATCGPYKSYWGTPTLPQPRSILILIFNIWHGFMTRVTPGHVAIGIMARLVTRVPETGNRHFGRFQTSTVQQG